MARKAQPTVYWLEVNPYSWMKGEAYDLPSVERTKELIERHLDNVRVRIAEQTDHACEFCNCAWTEKSPDYNGGCCGHDELNNPDLSAEDRTLILSQIAEKEASKLAKTVAA